MTNTKKENKAKENTGFYKGYDIEWLRSEKENHSDGYLVDEYDKLKGKNNG